MEGALVGKCDQISLHTYMKFSDNKKLSVISYLKKKKTLTWNKVSSNQHTIKQCDVLTEDVIKG